MKINFILMKGVVIKSTGSLCQVLSDNNKQYACKIKGKTRLLDLEFTNPITVGDFVELIGNNVLLSFIAKKSKTIPYEILNNIGNRAKKIYIDNI